MSDKKFVTYCRNCKHDYVQPIMNLGQQYLSDYRNDLKKPNKYLLSVSWCPKCFFVQLDQSAPFSEMYTENYGFKSGVNNTIKNDLRDVVDEVLSMNPHPKNVLDIGSNDGTLLSYYPRGIFRVGIDPIRKLCQEAAQHGDLIINDFFSATRIQKECQIKFNVITAISMFYDVEDPDEFVAELKYLLADDGILTIQQNYILATLVNNAYDNICHEHIGYHSLLSMEYLLNKHGLEVVDVSTSMVNGGVLRTVIQHKGVGKPTLAVQELRDKELFHELNTIRPYQRFNEQVSLSAILLRNLIIKINSEKKRCYIYGASTRGGTIWQFAHLDVNDLPFAVERNPDKVGKRIASIGVPIISEEQAREDMPEYMLVSIWFFKDEVVRREQSYIERGGTLIFPLPELTIVDKDGERKA